MAKSSKGEKMNANSDRLLMWLVFIVMLYFRNDFLAWNRTGWWFWNRLHVKLEICCTQLSSSKVRSYVHVKVFQEIWDSIITNIKLQQTSTKLEDSQRISELFFLQCCLVHIPCQSSAYEEFSQHKLKENNFKGQMHALNSVLTLIW